MLGNEWNCSDLISSYLIKSGLKESDLFFLDVVWLDLIPALLSDHVRSIDLCITGSSLIWTSLIWCALIWISGLLLFPAPVAAPQKWDVILLSATYARAYLVSGLQRAGSSIWELMRMKESVQRVTASPSHIFYQPGAPTSAGTLNCGSLGNSFLEQLFIALSQWTRRFQTLKHTLGGERMQVLNI